MNLTTRWKLLSQKSLNQLCFLVWRRRREQLWQTALDICLCYEMERSPWDQSTWWWKDSTSDWDVHMQTISYPALKKNEKRLAPLCPSMLFTANCCPSVLATSHIWYDRSHLWPVWVCACKYWSACVHVYVFVFVKTDVSTSLRVSSRRLVVDS